MASRISDLESPEPREPERTPETLSLAVHLVPMRRRHLRAVLRIEGQVYPRPWSLPLFLSELNLRTSRLYYVARVGGSVVGYCGVMLVDEDAHITNIAVDPAWHRHKIGTRLLLNAVRQSVAHGSTRCTLEVRMSNRGAQALYRMFGFLPAGVRKNYYTESREDALIMWADGLPSEEYHHRLAEIEAGVAGTTVVESGEPWR